MPQVIRTWSFLSDAEGLADVALSGSVAFGFEGGDGSPASGCVKFTTAGAVSAQTEKARRASTGQTWETWGVPAGAVVTNVQITSWRRKMSLADSSDTYRLRARVVDSAAASVHAAGDLIDDSVQVGGTGLWVTESAETLRGVDAGKAASTTDVRLELELYANGALAMDYRLDSIELTITYAASGSATGFAITPPAQATNLRQATPNYTITLSGGVAPVGGQAFVLSASGSGAFSPLAVVTVPEAAATVTFAYTPYSSGVQVLTAVAVGNPYAVNQATALCITGGIPVGDIIRESGMEFINAYLFVDDSIQNDTPIGKIQQVTISKDIALREVQGPEHNFAVGVGIAGRTVSGSFEGLVITPEMLAVLEGATIATRTAVADPTTNPTLAEVTSGGNITVVSGALYYAVAYSWVNEYGETKVKTHTVAMTAGSSRLIRVTPPAFASGVTSANLYVTPSGYLDATAALAAAAAGALRLSANVTSAAAYDITTLPNATARRDLTFSQIGTASRVATLTANAEPQKFRLQTSNPEDGSDEILYGCVLTNFTVTRRLKDFVSVSGSFNAYGDGTLPEPTIYKRVFPLGV